jgi:predicted nucleic acid-binding protein
MPEVIVNTSPIQYLFQLDLLDLLPELYGGVVVPGGVAREVATGLDRGVSLPGLSSLSWLEIREVMNPSILPLVTDLGGEREVLALALQIPGSLVILDDSLARRFADRLRLRMTGTLGILLKAKQTGRVDRLAPLLEQLERLHFRLDTATRASVLRLAGE